MQDIHDIRPPVAMGTDPLIVWVVLAVILSVVIISLIVFFVKKRGLRKRQRSDTLALPDSIPPFRRALDALQRLKDQQNADARIFHFELSMVLRQYLDSSFHCHTREMTSQQFIKALSGMKLSTGVKPAMIRFVNTSDPIKYGGVVPDGQQIIDDIQRVESWVTQIENRLAANRQQETEGD